MSEQIAAPVLSENNSGALRGLSTLVLLVACLTLAGCSGGSQPSGNKDSHGKSGGSATDTGATPEKAGAHLIGVWEGVLIGKMPERLEFKSNGRFSWTGGLVNFTGDWKVTREDGDLIVVQVIDDLHPGAGEGYKITVKGDNEIYLKTSTVFNGTLKRRR